jgi:hypothetical protein
MGTVITSNIAAVIVLIFIILNRSPLFIGVKSPKSTLSLRKRLYTFIDLGSAKIGPERVKDNIFGIGALPK